MENFLPKPCKFDGNGNPCKDYSLKEWFAKINEEVFEAHEKSVIYDYYKHKKFDKEFVPYLKNELAEELVDVITVCTSFLDALGYDEKARLLYFDMVNEKNQQRGYFGEV